MFCRILESWWGCPCRYRSRVSTIFPAIHHHRLETPGLAGAFRPTARATHVVVIMARGRGSRSLSICVASSGPPGCGDITRVRLHCTVEVIKPFVVQFKIRSSVVSVLISLICFTQATLDRFGQSTYQIKDKHVRKPCGYFVFGCRCVLARNLLFPDWCISSLLVDIYWC